MSEIKLIVGLGNPGSEYVATRHNVGFWLVDALSEQARQPLNVEPKFKASLATIDYKGHSLKILKPLTYMNRSGECVGAFARFYKITPENILVVHDDLDLPPGTARLKFDGGHGGNNGIRDIVSHLGTKEFYRLRLGIGHPGQKDDVTDYVLTKPSLSDKAKILEAINHTFDVLPDIVEGKMDKAMNHLHTVTK